jgi:hypothetical protein
VYRVCEGCGGVDEHPRHIVAGVIPDVHPAASAELRETVLANIKELAGAGKLTIENAMAIGVDIDDTTTRSLHIDCCAEAGCPKAGTPDGCDARVAVWNGKTGPGMVKAAEQVRADNPKHFQEA